MMNINLQSNPAVSLVPCLFCGKEEGYQLAPGNTYRWWLVQCASCRADVAECHSDRRTQDGTELPKSWPDADAAWNNAGKHAHGLRLALAELVRIYVHEGAAVTPAAQIGAAWASAKRAGTLMMAVISA